MKTGERIFWIADELRAIANQGLWYCKNEYDENRYKHMLSLSISLRSLIQGRDEEDFRADYFSDFSYQTPRAGAEAVVRRG